MNVGSASIDAENATTHDSRRVFRVLTEERGTLLEGI
jgi:hypothetical protein